MGSFVYTVIWDYDIWKKSLVSNRDSEALIHGHLVRSCRWISFGLPDSSYSELLGGQVVLRLSLRSNWCSILHPTHAFCHQTYEIHTEIKVGSHRHWGDMRWECFIPWKSAIWNAFLQKWCSVFGAWPITRKCPKASQCLRPGTGNADLSSKLWI